MRNVQREDCAGACGTTDSLRANSAFCREGNSRRDATAIGLAVFNVRLVTRDSVLGDCLSDETVQQGAADDDTPNAGVIWGLFSLAQHGWQLCIAGPAQLSATTGKTPIVKTRSNPTVLNFRDDIVATSV